MSPIDKKNRYNEIAQRYGDPWIWGIYFTLLVISIIESYSASSREIAEQGVYMPIIKQCIFLGVGAVAVILLYRIDYNKAKFLYAMIPGLAAVTIITLIYVMVAGKVINGAQRVLFLPGGFTLQPAELAKLSIVTLLAYILAKSQKNRDVSTRGILLSAFAVAVYGGLMLQSGLTNTLLLMTISFSMFLIGGARIRKILYVIIFYAVVAGLYFVIHNNNETKDENLRRANPELVAEGSAPTEQDSKAKTDRSGTWQSRINAWRNSDSLVYRPITDKNQQEMFSRMAQAHGGMFGVGIGRSRECSRLPLAFSDYIYSIIIEETGFAGACFVLLLYLWLLARAAMIVRRSKRVLPSLLVIGMASLITFQALFHMAINVGLFPVSGQPLPLISKGGTATLVMSIAFGVMLSVSRTIANYRNKSNKTTETLPEGMGDLDKENPTEIAPKNVWRS